MSLVIEHARALVRAGRWLDLRAMESDLLLCEGQDRLAAQGLLHMAYFNSATCASDWGRALQFGQDIVRTTSDASPMHLWALQAVASVYGNIGRPKESRAYALTFLRKASGRSEAQAMVPNGWHLLGHAARLEHHYDRAIQCYRMAEQGYLRLGNAVDLGRVRLKILWALVKSGRAEEARRHLPSEAPTELVALWHGAQALLAVAENDWERARLEAQEALSSPLLPLDQVVAAEMCHLLAQVNLRHGARAEAISWTKKATEFSARLGLAVVTRLVLATAAEGGDFLAAVASRGSGGYHPDACFSTGVGG